MFGVVAVTNAMLPLLRRSSWTRIVNLTSGLGSLYHATAGESSARRVAAHARYNSSKTAVNALTVTYAKELGEGGILVNAASPGLVATDLNDHQGTLTPEQGSRIPSSWQPSTTRGPPARFAPRTAPPTAASRRGNRRLPVKEP